MSTYSYRILGGSIDGGAFNRTVINGFEYIRHAYAASGACTCLGASVCSVLYSIDGSGYASTSGYSASVYAQLQVGGGSAYTSGSADTVRAYAITSAGYAQSSGDGVIDTVVIVQIMHTQRTAVVLGSDTQLFVPSTYLRDIQIIRTADRTATVPAVVDFYTSN